MIPLNNGLEMSAKISQSDTWIKSCFEKEKVP